MKAAYGMVDQVRDVPSQGVTRIVIEIPRECHVEATAMFHGARVLVTLAPNSMEGVTGYGIIEPGRAAPPKIDPGPKGGALCALAGTWCKDEQFTRFLAEKFTSLFNQAEGKSPSAEGMNAWVVREICQVASRRDLDSSPTAKAVFDNRIRLPYKQFLEDGGGE